MSMRSSKEVIRAKISSGNQKGNGDRLVKIGRGIGTMRFNLYGGERLQQNS